MASSTLRVTIRVDGARETLRAFRELPKDASDELRAGTLEISQTLAVRVAAAARGDNEQTALVAPTVRATRDRVPAIVAGGMRRVGRNRKPAYKILFGSEFGAHLKQFRPWIGQDSYWFFATVQENEDTIAAEWRDVADRIIDKWASE